MLDLQKLAAAKLWLISAPPGPAADDSPRDLPYLSQALYALVPVESDRVEAMTCDEWWRIYVNHAWLDSASIPEVGRQLAHVTWHLLADHTARARDMDVDRSSASLWEAATDATISHTLTPDHLRPDGLKTASDLSVRAGLSAEETFTLISGLPVGGGSRGVADESNDEPEQSQSCGSGCDGIPRSHELGPDIDLGGVNHTHGDEIRKQVAIDYQGHVARRGTDPGGDLRWIKESLDPKVPWETLLTGAVRRAVGWAAGRGDYTYSRPSRRASTNRSIVLPGQHRPVPRISIVVDTSGSVDDKLLARALGEVDGALAALGVSGAETTVYSVDAAVHTVQKVRRARDAKLVGAGGTDLRVGIQAVSDERPRPDVIIVFTDSYTDWPATPPPGSAVIAALLGRRGDTFDPTPAWVTRVECRLDEEAYRRY